MSYLEIYFLLSGTGDLDSNYLCSQRNLKKKEEEELNTLARTHL